MQLLITGVYRSGTEYITQLINNHPRLEIHMYVVSFMRFCWDRYNPIEDPYHHSRLLFDAAQRIYYRWNRKLDVYGILERLAGEDATYARLYDAIMIDLFGREDMAGWGEKTQLVWTKIAPFLDMFPEGKAILIVRDPRSVLLSFKNYTYTPPPAYLGAAFNCLDAMATGQKLQRTYGPDRFRIVRYEDIIDEPECSLIDLFAFLRLDVRHNLLSMDDWVDAKGHPWKHNSTIAAQLAPGTAFPAKENATRWQRELDPREISFCETIVGQELSDYGYAPFGSPASTDELFALVHDHARNDEALVHHLRRWCETGQGIEAFPTDPIDRDNWAAERAQVEA